MLNLQLIDNVEAGSLDFERNDYTVDNGIYTKLYCALFSTSYANWWGDGAFGIVSENATSKTGIALRTNTAINEKNKNIIKKAVLEDLKKLTNKDKNIQIKGVEIAHWSNTKLIIIELVGNNESYNFYYQKVKEDLTKAKFTIY